MVGVAFGSLQADSQPGSGNVSIQTRSTYFPQSMTAIIEIPTANLGSLTTTNSKKVSLDDSNNYRQPEMAAETGNTYIAETVRDGIEIPRQSLRVIFFEPALLKTPQTCC